MAIPVLRSKTLIQPAECPFPLAYDFLSDPDNFPLWAPAFFRSLRKSGNEWIADTPEGEAAVRFAGRNESGVLDHWVVPLNGKEAARKTVNPMRVLPRGPDGCAVMVTVFQQPDMTHEQFLNGVETAEEELRKLKRVLEERTAE